jgi:hypothetical protein
MLPECTKPCAGKSKTIKSVIERNNERIFFRIVVGFVEQPRPRKQKRRLLLPLRLRCRNHRRARARNIDVDDVRVQLETSRTKKHLNDDGTGRYSISCAPLVQFLNLFDHEVLKCARFDGPAIRHFGLDERSPEVCSPPFVCLLFDEHLPVHGLGSVWQCMEARFGKDGQYRHW